MKSKIQREAEIEKLLNGKLKERIISRLLEDPNCSGFSGFDLKEIEDRILDLLLSEGQIKPKKFISALAKNIHDEIFGFGPLEENMKSPEITEIMINGPANVFIEQDGIIKRTGISFESPEKVVQFVRRIIAPLNLRLDETSPMVDARLPDGSRLNAVIPPLCLNGPTVTIRRFRGKRYDAKDLVACGTMNQEICDFLKESVTKRANILISGGASSGKTTMLNALCAYIPPEERIITIEDTAELQIPHDHVISLESRPPNIEGRGAVTVRDLVRNALRMRPDRIIVGEVRGAEALDMLQAMNTGHPGSISTAHANSPADLIHRLEIMVMMSDLDLNLEAVRRQIGSAIDLIIHMEREAGGKRILKEICGVSLEGDGRIRVEQICTRANPQIQINENFDGSDKMRGEEG